MWDAAEGALYWVDIQAGLLQRWMPGTDQVERWTMPERVGALALRADRGLVLALASGFALFDPATDDLERRAAPEAHLPGNRFNDGKCDARGRFWAGTMDDAALHLTGSLYRLDPDGRCSTLEAGIGISIASPGARTRPSTSPTRCGTRSSPATSRSAFEGRRHEDAIRFEVLVDVEITIGEVRA